MGKKLFAGYLFFNIDARSNEKQASMLFAFRFARGPPISIVICHQKKRIDMEVNMSLTFFIIDENGTFQSTDNTKLYRRLSGEQLYQYLNSPEGKCKRFYIDYETGVGVEIPDELVFSFREEDRHKQYLSDMKKKHDYKLISLSEPATNTGISGEEVIPDMSTSVPEEAERSILLQELRKAIHKLTAEEFRIINYLYLSENCCTQEQLAQRLGISQQAVSKRCKTILKKLKKYFSV